MEKEHKENEKKVIKKGEKIDSKNDLKKEEKGGGMLLFYLILILFVIFAFLTLFGIFSQSHTIFVYP